MLKYKLHVIAREDVREVLQYYENERPGLGTDFFREFKDTVKLLRTHPRIGALREDNIRRFSLDRFSYDIFYYIEDDIIWIAGVLHQRRNPNLIRSRLKDLPE